MSKYLDLSIKEINELLKKKEIKPIDLVNEAFERIEANSNLNALKKITTKTVNSIISKLGSLFK